MPADLRWGIGVPQIFPDQPVDMSLIRRWTLRAEQLGFDSLWTMEGITGGLATLEPVTLLSYMSALTERVKLGVSVIIAPHRNPVQLAKALGSLDTINRGRLIVGIGLGHRIMSDTFGISAEHRVGRFVEIMDVLKALWTRSQANYSGRFWKLQDTRMEPKPIQKPHPPIWQGGIDKKSIPPSAQRGTRRRRDNEQAEIQGQRGAGQASRLPGFRWGVGGGPHRGRVGGNGRRDRQGVRGYRRRRRGAGWESRGDLGRPWRACRGSEAVLVRGGGKQTTAPSGIHRRGP